jgi:hypothetical protein
MKYDKPEIVRLPDAFAAVQGIGKELPPMDGDHPDRTTVTAYEADE